MKINEITTFPDLTNINAMKINEFLRFSELQFRNVMKTIEIKKNGVNAQKLNISTFPELIARNVLKIK